MITKWDNSISFERKIACYQKSAEKNTAGQRHVFGPVRKSCFLFWLIFSVASTKGVLIKCCYPFFVRVCVDKLAPYAKLIGYFSLLAKPRLTFPIWDGKQPYVYAQTRSLHNVSSAQHENRTDSPSPRVKLIEGCND